MTVKNLAAQLSNITEQALADCGIIFRIFHRSKSDFSLRAKIDREPGKYGEEKKIQDVIGIRIALYFLDDIEIAKSILCEKFNFLAEHSKIDEPEHDEFSANRFNLIFALPDEFDAQELFCDEFKGLVDSAFEVQIRTILSEGWHEIDHDLRFKAKGDWVGLNRESRTLNGVYATLETCEWTLLKIFEDVAYKHYKGGSWEAMLQNKFRLRFSSKTLSPEMIGVLDSDRELGKKIFRFDRREIFNEISKRSSIPITAENIIHIINCASVHDEALSLCEDLFFKKWWNQNESVVEIKLETVGVEVAS